MSRKTNNQFIIDLMDFSQSGPLMQVFVLTAIQRYAEAVLKNPLPEGGMINSEVWTRCALEAKSRLEEHFNG